ncbi:MAG TPA: rod shape-determining protein MreC [Longimicrobiaceae bacterium]|nr:rod shape-determining protein MreC [Longimicrobiaceae bacterium]
MAGAFAGLSALLLVMPAPYRDAVGHAVRSTVLAPAMALQRGASDREGRYADASTLRAERDSLVSFLVGQSNLAAENRELRSLLGFRDRLAYSFVAAEADRSSGVGSQGTLRLSVGERDGVRPDAVLVTADGLVGKVWKLGDESSVATDWSHEGFAVAVMTVDGETYGIAKPIEGPGGERMLALTPVAFHTVPDTGSLVVTSGDGALFPRGIPVGKVVGQGKAAGGWQRTYYIRPNVTPARMSHVLVLGPPGGTATDQSLAASWGIRLTDTQVADTSRRAVAPDAATPQAPTLPGPRAPAARPRPRPRLVDPTPELPGRPVFPGQPRVPPGAPPPADTTRR